MVRERVRDNPNPKANIALLCPYPFFYYNYETIYRQLPNAEFVPEPMAPIGRAVPDVLPNKLRGFLAEKGVHWRDPAFSGLTTSEFFSKYALLVAPYGKGYVCAPENKNKKRARLFYGGAKDLWGFALWNAHFDLFLTPGPYYNEGLKRYSGEALATGEPKLDPLAHTTRDDALRALGIALDPAKKTILVLSTWGELSTLPILVPSLVPLASEYNVVVKIHHMTEYFESETVRLFDGTPTTLLFEQHSIAHALLIADIVMSDNSGAIFDAVLAHKDLVLIDALPPLQYRYVETPSESELSPIFRRRTNEQSVEQVVKREGREVAPVVRGALAVADPLSYEKISAAIRNADDPLYRARRARFLAEHLTLVDGKAGERGAAALQKLARSEVTRDRFLEDLVDSFEYDIHAASIDECRRKMQERETRYEQINRIKTLPLLARLRAIIELLQ